MVFCMSDAEVTVTVGAFPTSDRALTHASKSKSHGSRDTLLLGHD